MLSLSIYTCYSTKKKRMQMLKMEKSKRVSFFILMNLVVKRVGGDQHKKGFPEK